jgi:hypothetical protein
MRALTVAIAITACAWVDRPVHGAELHLRYSLNEDSSNMALFPRNKPPRFRRFLSGKFDVIVRERFPAGFVFEIRDLHFRSVEDDQYDVQADSGTILLSDSEIELDLEASVNGDRRDYRPAMRGPDRDLLKSSWPPVFRNLGVLSSKNARGEEFWIHVYAEATFCPADCNQDGASTVDELVTCLNVALGIAESDTCPTCDLNGDGSVSIDEVVASVDTVLNGCE